MSAIEAEVLLAALMPSAGLPFACQIAEDLHCSIGEETMKLMQAFFKELGLRKNLRSNLLLMWEVVEAAAHNSLLTRTLPPDQVSKGAKDFGKSI